MIKEIIQIGHPTLRQTCQAISISDIQSPEIKQIITDLSDTLANEADGVGLSAPQIDIKKRIFILSPLAFQIDKKKDIPEKPVVFINPKIINASKKQEWMDEGCLSIRWVYGQVKRHKQITVEFYDESGTKKTVGFSGVLSHAIQHEIDHLDGVLFIDKAKNLQELSPEEIAELKKQMSKNES